MQEWYGFDLDGTLAFFDRWRGDYHIGKPIPAMIQRVRKHIQRGDVCKIFTARASKCDQKINDFISDWAEEHIGTRLEVTCAKDMFCVRIYDDIAIQVQQNTGKIVTVVNKMKER
jgi:hypothetical protein